MYDTRAIPVYMTTNTCVPPFKKQINLIFPIDFSIISVSSAQGNRMESVLGYKRTFGRQRSGQFVKTSQCQTLRIREKLVLTRVTTLEYIVVVE